MDHRVAGWKWAGGSRVAPRALVVARISGTAAEITPDPGEARFREIEPIIEVDIGGAWVPIEDVTNINLAPVMMPGALSATVDATAGGPRP